MRSLGKLAKKLEKWEPLYKGAVQNEVSISKTGVGILAWATGYFKGYKEVDLYVDRERTLMGIKPAAKGQRKLSSKVGGSEFFVSCTSLMRQAGVSERKNVPAEWDDEKKMLIVHLKGRKPAK